MVRVPRGIRKLADLWCDFIDRPFSFFPSSSLAYESIVSVAAISRRPWVLCYFSIKLFHEYNFWNETYSPLTHRRHESISTLPAYFHAQDSPLVLITDFLSLFFLSLFFSSTLSTSTCESCQIYQRQYTITFTQVTKLIMPEYVYALHDFLPEHEDEVSFHAGERIEVVEKDDLYGDGWWQV